MTDAPMPPETPSGTTSPTPKPIVPETPEAAANSVTAGTKKFEFSSITKAVIQVLTLVVAVGTPLLSYTTGILPEKVAYTISAVVGISGTILHYIAPNTTTNPEVAQSQSVKLKA